VAKCIVCNKSAGPFYALHKACLPVYRDTQKCVREKLTKFIASDSKISDEDILSCRPSPRFSEHHFKKICVQAWQDEAKRVASNTSLDISSAKNLLKIAEALKITGKDTEPYLFSRLTHVEYLAALQNNQPVKMKIEKVPDLMELESNEYVIWEFKDTEKTEQEKFSQQKEWTILSSVLDNLLMRSRYKELDQKIEEAGNLFVTNQSLYYQVKDSVTQTKFTDIHSITPLKNGVRVQPHLRDAMPETYITGDGRFTYALLQYAQE
jgi:hypothetical protein